MGRVVLFKLYDFIGGCLSLIPAALAIGGKMASRVQPQEAVEWQWLGLFLNLILGINILLFAYWLIRKKGWFLIPLFAILWNISFFPRILQWPFGDFPQAPDSTSLCIASYNIRNTLNRTDETTRSMSRYICQAGVDILCIQEFPLASKEETDFIYQLFDCYPYHVVVTSPSSGGMSIALFSKYPILQHAAIRFPHKSKNCAMWADVSIKGKSIRIFNHHLQTTNVNQNRAKIKDLSHILSNYSEIKRIADENFRQRGEQANIISRMIKQSPYPPIVCGDFNDTPASYAYRKIKGSLTDSFSSCGKGYEYTYLGFYKLFRIDYIFYSGEAFKGIRHDSPDLKYSDHKPVIVNLDITPLLDRKEPQSQM